MQFLLSYTVARRILNPPLSVSHQILALRYKRAIEKKIFNS